MRLRASAVKVAFGMLVLVSGSLHAQRDVREPGGLRVGRGQGLEDRPDQDWPMYGRNLSHTFSNENSLINPSNVSSLQRVWFFPTGDAVSASPTVVGGVVYVGSWDGFFYALDAHSGELIWKFQVDCQNSVLVRPWPPQCIPAGTLPPDRSTTDGGLITSSAAVIDNNVYFAGGKTLYSLNATDGSLRWKQVICGNPEAQNCSSDANDPTRIFSSPALFGGLLFIGHTVDGVAPYRGGFEAIDAATGEIRWRFEVDTSVNNHQGCGNVWSSAAIDEILGLVFFGTGDCHDVAPPPYHEAVIALEYRTGKPRWVFRRPTDPIDINHCDFDFGASPNIIDMVHGRFLGIGGKDGTYYLLNRLTGDLVWQTNVVFGGISGGFYGGAAFDGTHIFSATGIGDFNPLDPTKRCSSDQSDILPFQEPSIHAFDAANGHIFWKGNLNHSFGATSLGNGVVFSGLVGLGVPPGPPALNAYDAGNGKLLKPPSPILMPGSVNSAATPVGDMLFVTSGNSTDGTGGGVHAFKLP